MDAFRVAFRVPNLLRDLFAEGAMSAAFVPTFVGHLKRGGPARAWRLGSSVLNGLILVTGAIVLVGLLLAPMLVRFLAGDFTEVPGKIELTITLARIVLPFLTLVALAAALMGMLNALGHFFIPAFSPAMFNLASIVVIVALVPFSSTLGLEPIHVVAIGTIVGGLAQVLIQWPPLRGEGYRYEPVIDARDEGLRRVLFLMGPGTIGMAATQVNVLVNTFLATGQGTGAVSWLEYAFRLMYLPIGIFGVSIATASVPVVSRLVADENYARVRSTLAHAISLMLLLNIPATLGLIVLAEPIVRLLLERGSFTAADTLSTAAALQFYAIGLVGYSVVRIVSPTFYALGLARIPVTISVSSIAINIALNLSLVMIMGFRGLALGTSMAALLNAALQIWFARRKLGGIDGRVIAVSFARVGVASLAMALAAWGSYQWLAQAMPGGSLVIQIARLALAMAAALAVLSGAAAVLRIPEFGEAVAMVRRRLGL